MKPGRPERRTPLTSSKPLESRTELKNTQPLKRQAPLRNRSKKMAKLYVTRAALVEQLLQERPWCEIRWDAGCQGRAVDVDEILSRGRGGDFLDPENCQTTCRHCHDKKHTEPTEALERGVAEPSWGGEAA